MSKEHRSTDVSFSSLGQIKRRPPLDEDCHGTKKRKSGFSESAQKLPTGSNVLQHHHLDKKVVKDKPQVQHTKLRNNELADRRKVSALPPFQDVVDSDMDDNLSNKSDVSGC